MSYGDAIIVDGLRAAELQSTHSGRAPARHGEGPAATDRASARQPAIRSCTWHPAVTWT